METLSQLPLQGFYLSLLVIYFPIPSANVYKESQCQCRTAMKEKLIMSALANRSDDNVSQKKCLKGGEHSGNCVI